MESFSLLTLAARLALTLNGLHAAVAARRRISVLVGRGTEVLAEALIILICGRIRRTQNRILLLLATFQAGRLRVWRPGRVAAARVKGVEVKVSRARTTVQRAEGKLPRRLAWLLPLVPCEAANYAAQLRVMLAEPEMVALLAASAQARRVLRPLGRMLGIEPALLAPGGAPSSAMGSPENAGPMLPERPKPGFAGAGDFGVVRGDARQHGPSGNGGRRFARPP